MPMRRALAFLFLLFLPASAWGAQSSWLWWGDKNPVPVSSTNPLPITGAGVYALSLVCDGNAVDQAPIIRSALAAHGVVTLNTAGGTAACRIGSTVTIGTSQQLNLESGQSFQPAAGLTGPMFKVTGFNPIFGGGQLQDPSNVLGPFSTTLSGTAAPGATTLGLTSATNFTNGGQFITYTLNSGLRVPTGNPALSGTTLTLREPVPASVSNGTAATVTAGGNGCNVGDQLMVSDSTSTAVGAPATVKVATLTGGAGSGAATVTTVGAPGIWTTVPGAGVKTIPSSANPNCLGVAVTLTTSGAASGNAVTASYHPRCGLRRR